MADILLNHDLVLDQLFIVNSVDLKQKANTLHFVSSSSAMN